ncbi:RNA methyltransferase [Lachnospiraceae bacterium 46-15]
MITSMSNMQMKNLVRLQKKGKARREQDVFVVEGMKMYREAPRELIEKVYISQSFSEKPEASELLGCRNVEVVDDRIFQGVSDTKTPQGILAVIRRQHYSLEQVLRGENPLVLVLENIQDPGNLGTILRTGEGAGVTGIVMSADTVDIYNPKTIRSTMGSVYRMPFCYAEDMAQVMDRLNQRGISVYAAHLKGSMDYDQMDYRKSCGFLIGNEGSGLGGELAARADGYIRIPMCGEVESLNAGVASAVLMYEAFRQRRI